MIYYSFGHNGNVGRFYNSFMKSLPNDNDFAFFVNNGEITISNYNDVIEKIIDDNKDINCFISMTNKSKYSWQNYLGIDDKNIDIDYHENFGKIINEIYGTYCADITNIINFVPINGLLINKKTWLKFGGFTEDIKQDIDLDLYEKILIDSEKVCLMKGLYLYNFHEHPKIKDKIIIIPVHNQLPYLIKCISTVISHTKSFKLIVVDDGSTDDETIEWIDGNTDKFDLVRNKTAMGFSIACNKGIDYAMQKFDFNCLCLLNSDTEIVTNNWFDKVEHYFKENEKLGLASVVSDNATHQSIENVGMYLKNIDRKPICNTQLVHGFCFFIGKNLISTIGRFDDDKFPHYGSEDDYSLKSIKYGFKNIIVGAVFVSHKGQSSYTTDIRANYIKKSYPNLINRWTKKYVDECLKNSLEIQKLLNQ